MIILSYNTHINQMFVYVVFDSLPRPENFIYATTEAYSPGTVDVAY